MVVQWEDRFMSGRRAHAYLGPVDHPEALGEGDGTMPESLPELRGDREGLRNPGEAGSQQGRVSERLSPKLLASKEPYLLDVICPYQEHVLPMIPKRSYRA